MTLPPEIQTLVDQIVQVMGLQAIRPSGFDINMDIEGIVQDVKPKLIWRRAKEVDRRKKSAPN
jgi:hypothetical protein